MNTLYQQIGESLRLGPLRDTEVIQTLWSGYGELVRLHFSHQTVIVKHARLPEHTNHPRGWNTDRSHQRKVRSYQVEVNWYNRFSTPIDSRCPMPQCLQSFQSESEWLIVMEDLATAGFNTTAAIAKKSHLEACLHWLANFHARYMGTHSELIWESGTYWHLQTRPDELKALKDQRLKEHAGRIDEALKQSSYMSVVHGDAKVANFCFTADGSAAAAVDFQYVGHGCGIKDVAYFMGSAIEPEACPKMETWVLDTYFAALHEALTHYHPYLDGDDVEQQWRPLFCVAWADFQRFIKGWSPGHYKINAYSESMTARALEYLNRES